MIEIAPSALADHVPAPLGGFRRFIRCEPLGTVLVIAPWNYPYLSAVNSVWPALMAGNAVLLKHAAQTLLVGERFQAAFDRAELPKGLFRNLVLDHDQTAKIIRSGRVHQVNFTGSVGAGREIETAAAGTFIGTGLELGGKDPAYVRADANLPFAIENIADGAFFNSGQSCCAVERVYVHKRHFDRVVDGLVDVASKYVLGNPLDPQTTLGPMVRFTAAEYVRAQIHEAVGQGARRLVPENIFPPDERCSAYLAPEVLINVNHDMAIMRDETFGPVVGVMPVESDEEAIRLMNNSPYGLSASIWTQDADAAERIGEQLETGTVFMNRCDYLDPALAWTGVKETGRGITLSALGYATLTRVKSFHLREIENG
jgi:acyl-CoA reductase-like NAD-dependent aldehyde dehydrogenase